MKRIFLLVVAMCLLLTACGTKPDSHPVQTDWSKLTPYETQSPIYSYYEPRSEDGKLQPQDDYGTLLPYMGAMLTADHYSVDLYGLVTTDGQIVTEPIYSNIHSEGAFLQLTQNKLQHNEDRDTIRYYDFVAASDGSWVREIESFHSAFSYKNNYLVISLDDGSVIVLNDDGTVAAEFPRSVFEQYYGEDYDLFGFTGSAILEEYNGILYMKHYDKNDLDIVYLDLILDVDTGTVSDELPEGFAPKEDSEFEEEITPFDASEYRFLQNCTDKITGEIYYRGTIRIDDMEYQDLLDETGQIVFSHEYNRGTFPNFDVRAGCVSFAYDGYFWIYSLETGEVVFSYLIRNNTD